MDISEGIITVPSLIDGFPLKLNVFEPSRTGRTGLVISCATGVPAAFYASFARYCASYGISVITWDYRLTGASFEDDCKTKEDKRATLRANQNVRISEHWGKRDMRAVLQYALERFNGLDLVHLGHSLGFHAFPFAVEERAKFRCILICSQAAWHGYSLHKDFSVGMWKRATADTERGRRTEVLDSFQAFDLLDGYFDGREYNFGGWIPTGCFKQWRDWCHMKHYYIDDPEVSSYPLSLSNPGTISVGFDDDILASIYALDGMLEPLTRCRPAVRAFVNVEREGWRDVGHVDVFRTKHKAAWDKLLIPLIVKGSFPTNVAADVRKFEDSKSRM